MSTRIASRLEFCFITLAYLAVLTPYHAALAGTTSSRVIGNNSGKTFDILFQNYIRMVSGHRLDVELLDINSRTIDIVLCARLDCK